MHTSLSKQPIGALLVFVRLLFAGLITYVATQAHGWAGGYAADPRLTALVWLGLSISSVLWRDIRHVAFIAFATQVLVHLVGTSACEMHHAGMMSSQQMLVAHSVVGLAAAVLMLKVEAAITALDTVIGAVLEKMARPLRLLASSGNRVTIQLRTEILQSLWRVHGIQLRNLIEGRGPPVFV